MGGETPVSPYPYQVSLAESDRWPTLLEIPTGLGKTEAVVLAYLYRALILRKAEPRLMVYTLPMRSLVEQTVKRIVLALERLHASSDFGHLNYPSVESLLGGDVSTRWIEYPEERAIVVATQDMALSRALNRGYAMSRFQWPMAFGAISNDILYVVDEVQLHGVGAITAAQLQGLSKRFGHFGQRQTIFMSATIDTARIDTVDFPVSLATPRLSLGEADRSHQGVERLLTAAKPVMKVTAESEAAAAASILDAHEPGTLTLAIVNTVKRARAIFAEIGKRAPETERLLMHSRFRAVDRDQLAQRLSALDADAENGSIIVATQVIEAGVDISAQTLLSDVAPWSSIVQRLGRCNRRAQQNRAARFLWFDDPNIKAAPYDPSDLAASRELLLGLEGESACPSRLSTIPAPPYVASGEAVLRSSDLIDLFDTTTDLSGNDVDVSRYIRDGDESTVFVFWRASAPTKNDPPRRDELCPVAREELYGVLDKLAATKSGGRARVVNPLAHDRKGSSEERWQIARKPIRVGEIVWLATDVGCYDSTRGFDPSRFEKENVEEVDRRGDVELAPDESIDDDNPCYIGSAVTLQTHSDDAREAAQKLVSQLAAINPPLLSTTLGCAVVDAAFWHDAGKAHPVFQDTMNRSLARAEYSIAGGPWAKSVGHGRHSRAHFRHELASALVWLQLNRDKPSQTVDLIAYLIAAHHGKLRMSAYTLAGENSDRLADAESDDRFANPSGTLRRSILGIVDREEMPIVQLGETTVASFPLDLRNFAVGTDDDSGIGSVWDDRVIGLIDDPMLGPFRLAYLELLVRLADWRASAKRQDLVARDRADSLSEAQGTGNILPDEASARNMLEDAEMLV